MKMQSVTPNLMVKDVNATVEFYTNILGFAVIQQVPESGSLEWAFVGKEGVQLMFQKESSIKEEYPVLEEYKKGGALTLYIRISEGLEEVFEKVKDHATVIKPIQKTFYGANEFAIQDLNGFILTFSDITE